MVINQRKIGILLTYANEAIKIITALVYTPLMLRLLGQSEYGLYQMVSSVVSYLSLLSFGFGSAYVRYYSRYQVKDDRQGIARLNGMFLIIFCTLAVICLVCGGVMTVNADLIFGSGLTEQELSTAKVLLTILIVNMALTFPNSVFDCYVTAHEHFFFQKMLRLAQSALNPFLTLPLLLLGYGSVAMVIISTVLTVGVLMANLFYCYKKLVFEVCFHKLDFSLLKEMASFTFFIFLNQIIDQVNWSVDKFLLGRMSGTIAVAVYGVGGQINSLYIQMSTAVSGVFTPKVNQIVASSDNNTELTQLMAKVGRVQFIILAPIMTGFLFFGQSFIRLWAGQGYGDAYWVAVFLMFPFTVPLLQNLGIEIQRAKNMHRARSVVYTCLALGNILISIVLIQHFGTIGAAGGTAIATLLGQILFMNWYYHYKIGLNMAIFWKEILKFLPALLMICVVGFFLNICINISDWYTLLTSILIYCLFYCAIMWLIGFNAYEKQLVYQFAQKLCHRPHF